MKQAHLRPLLVNNLFHNPCSGLADILVLGLSPELSPFLHQVTGGVDDDSNPKIDMVNFAR
jgi:hypothetical protein